MATLIKQESFAGFGNSIVPRAARKRAVTFEIPQSRLDARKVLREVCPKLPGVYGMVNRNGRLIYVGKSKSLQSRLLSYFAKTPADEKMTKIVRQATFILVEPTTHELSALLREQELISRFRPRLNTQDQPTRRQPAYIGISKGHAPHAYFSRTISSRTQIGYGPIPGTGLMSEAAASLNYAFGLRDCPDKTPMTFPDQLELFPQQTNALCLRHELGTCLAPCAKAVSRNLYQTQVDRAHDFLTGKNTEILQQLSLHMQQSANNRAFERASVLRDRLDHLAWLDGQLEKLRVARQVLHGIFRVPGFRAQDVWLVFRNSVLQGGFAQPKKSTSRKKELNQLKNWETRQPEQILTIPEILMQLRLISWFRKHPQDELKILSFKEAKCFCGDDGREVETQVANAAVKPETANSSSDSELPTESVAAESNDDEFPLFSNVAVVG